MGEGGSYREGGREERERERERDRIPLLSQFPLQNMIRPWPSSAEYQKRKIPKRCVTVQFYFATLK